MQFNYNVKPVDIGAYFRGREMYDQRQQREQQQQEKERLQELGKAAMAGDMGALQDIAAINPQYAAQLAQFQQSQRSPDIDFSTFGEQAQQLSGLLKSNSPMAIPFIQDMASQYAGSQLQPAINDWIATYQQNPQEALQQLDDMGAAFEKPKDPKVGRFRSERIGDELVWFDTATSQEVSRVPIPESRKEKLELKKLKEQTKKAESEAQLKALTAKSDEDKRQASIDMANEAATLARELAADPSLDQAVGTLTTMTPTLRESTQDVINKAQRLESLLTVDNLKLMTGVLTDRDIAFLTRVASGLNITDNGIKGSYQATVERLNDIANKIESGISGTQGGPAEQKDNAGSNEFDGFRIVN